MTAVRAVTVAPEDVDLHPLGLLARWRRNLRHTLSGGLTSLLMHVVLLLVFARIAAGTKPPAMEPALQAGWLVAAPESKLAGL